MLGMGRPVSVEGVTGGWWPGGLRVVDGAKLSLKGEADKAPTYPGERRPAWRPEVLGRETCGLGQEGWGLGDFLGGGW